MPQTEPNVSIADVAGRVLDRWRTVVVTVLVIVLAALLVGWKWPVQYSATAVVTVSPITATPFEPAQVNIETERAVVVSTEVAQRAAETLETDRSPADLLTSVAVTAPDQSQVLQIRFTSTAPDAAAEGANAFAEAYLELRARSADQIAQRIIKNLETRINQLTEAMPSPPGDDEDGNTAGDQALQQQIVSMQQQIAELRAQQNSLATVALNPGRAIGPAEPPTSPSSPGLPVFLAAGLVFGLLAGVTLALIRDRTDARVRTARRLAEALGEPVVADAGGDHREPFRRALLALAPDDHPAGAPLVVNVQSFPARGRVRDAAAELADAIRDTGKAVTVIRVDDDFGSMIDRGWPRPNDRVAWVRADFVVVDSSRLSSPTRRELLARRCDRNVLVSHAGSKIAEVVSGVTDLRAMDVRVDVVLALTRVPHAHPSAPSPSATPASATPPAKQPDRPGSARTSKDKEDSEAAARARSGGSAR